MRNTTRAFVAVLVLGVVAFVALAVFQTSRTAFSLNVPNNSVIAKLKPGAQACQDRISVPIGGGFTSVRVPIGTDHQPGPPMTATLQDADGAVVARASVAAGFADNSSPLFSFGSTERTGNGYRLCLTNDGDRAVYLYGSGGDPNPSTTLTVDGKPQLDDAVVEFERPSRSLAAAAGDVFARSALFRTPRLSGLAYGLLLLVLLSTAVVGTVIALRAAVRDDEHEDEDEDAPGNDAAATPGRTDAGDDTAPAETTEPTA